MFPHPLPLKPPHTYLAALIPLPREAVEALEPVGGSRRGRGEGRRGGRRARRGEAPATAVLGRLEGKGVW